jgi:hypothetical protein
MNTTAGYPIVMAVFGRDASEDITTAALRAIRWRAYIAADPARALEAIAADIATYYTEGTRDERKVLGPIYDAVKFVSRENARKVSAPVR